MHSYPIEQIVPHAHPMILIDRLIDYSPDSARCEVDIKPGINFFDNARLSVPSYVGLEYLAQSIAAYANVQKILNGEEVALGFLVSARNYKASVSEFPAGAKLITSVTKLFKEENGLSVFDCTITSNNDVIIETKINVFEPEDPSLFLSGEAK